MNHSVIFVNNCVTTYWTERLINLVYIMNIRVFHVFLDFMVYLRLVSVVFEDLKFKISEGSDQNGSFPGSALLAVPAKMRPPIGQRQENFNFTSSLLKF